MHTIRNLLGFLRYLASAGLAEKLEQAREQQAANRDKVFYTRITDLR